MVIWGYKTLTEFKNARLGNKIISFSDLVKERIVVNGNEELHCWIAKKDKRDYLIRNDIIKDLPIKILETQQHNENLSIYHFVSDYAHIGFTAEKGYEFRELINRFFDVPHSNPKHFRMIKRIAFASHFSRVNARICAPIEFGKDGTFEVLGFLTNSIVVLDEPESMPRVKSAMNSSVLVLNEIVATGEFASIFKKIYLSLGSRKPDYYPPKLGKDGSSTPIDVNNLSLITCYNLYSEVSEKDKENYFDFVFGKNVFSRYIPFKFSGKIDMSMFRNPPPYNLNIDNELLKMSRTVEWYKQHYKEELKPYHIDLSNSPLSDREKDSFLNIADIINLDSETEEEFKALVNELLDCHYAYKRMLNSSNLITDYSNEQKFQFRNNEKEEELKIKVEEVTDTLQNEVLSPLNAIIELDNGEGVLTDEIAKKLNISVGELYPSLVKLSHNGDIFQNKPDRWKVLN